MPRGGKSKYTEKQKRKAEDIEEGYEQRGVPKDEAERRAWATVNKMDRGGEKPGGSGYGKPKNLSPARKGGKLGGRASPPPPAGGRAAGAEKGAAAPEREAAARAGGGVRQRGGPPAAAAPA